jgi:hypothetical protein
VTKDDGIAPAVKKVKATAAPKDDGVNPVKKVKVSSASKGDSVAAVEKHAEATSTLAPKGDTIPPVGNKATTASTRKDDGVSPVEKVKAASANKGDSIPPVEKEKVSTSTRKDGGVAPVGNKVKAAAPPAAFEKKKRTDVRRSVDQIYAEDLAKVSASINIPDGSTRTQRAATPPHAPSSVGPRLRPAGNGDGDSAPDSEPQVSEVATTAVDEDDSLDVPDRSGLVEEEMDILDAIAGDVDHYDLRSGLVDAFGPVRAPVHLRERLNTFLSSVDEKIHVHPAPAAPAGRPHDEDGAFIALAGEIVSDVMKTTSAVTGRGEEALKGIIAPFTRRRTARSADVFAEMLRDADPSKYLHRLQLSDG